MELPIQHLAIIQRLGVLGCSAARVSSRIRSQQSSAPRVLLDGRKSAKIDASLEIIWGIPDNEVAPAMAIIHSIYRYPVKGLSPEALPRIALAPGETVPATGSMPSRTDRPGSIL